MKVISICSILLSITLVSAFANPAQWNERLERPVSDEWLQIMGYGLEQNSERPAETLAAKIAAIQELLFEESGQRLPIFIPPSFGVSIIEAIPESDEPRVGLPLSNVPVGEALRYIADLNHCEISVSEVGVIFRPKDQ
jgi:hypothetical protein